MEFASRQVFVDFFVAVEASEKWLTQKATQSAKHFLKIFWLVTKIIPSKFIFRALIVVSAISGLWNLPKILTCLKARPDNSAKDNSADLKFRQFSQKYADNSANSSDRRSRANVLRACHQRVGLYTKFRAGYRRKAARRA